MHAVIDARYIRPKPSGIGKHVRSLVGALTTAAPTDSFTLVMNPDIAKTWREEENVIVRAASGDPQGLATLFAPSLLAPLKEADVFHAPHNLLGPRIPCASVVTIHDLMWLNQPALVEGNPLLRGLGYPLFSSATLRAIKYATRIIAVSNATADAIVRTHPSLKSRLRVIYNGVDGAYRPLEEDAQARGEGNFDSKDPYVVMMGTSQPYKAHDTGIRAFAAAKLSNHRLVLVQRRSGRGYKLEQLAESLGIADRLVWKPALSESNVIKLLQGADALLHPSRMEGFGLPPLEAMACGCPVVVSDTPALVEVVGNAGLVEPVDDAVKLGAALRRLVLESSLRAELVQCGLERAAGFRWNIAAQQTLEVYREAAEEGGRHGD